MNRRLVTVFGGSGFVGRNLVQRLAEDGWTVRVAVRDTEAALFLKVLGGAGQIVPIAADVTDRDTVDDAVPRRGCGNQPCWDPVRTRPSNLSAHSRGWRSERRRGRAGRGRRPLGANVGNRSQCHFHPQPMRGRRPLANAWPWMPSPGHPRLDPASYSGRRTISSIALPS